jgi:hypothetical protein
MLKLLPYSTLLSIVWLPKKLRTPRKRFHARLSRNLDQLNSSTLDFQFSPCKKKRADTRDGKSETRGFRRETREKCAMEARSFTLDWPPLLITAEKECIVLSKKGNARRSCDPKMYRSARSLFYLCTHARVRRLLLLRFASRRGVTVFGLRYRAAAACASYGALECDGRTGEQRSASTPPLSLTTPNNLSQPARRPPAFQPYFHSRCASYQRAIGPALLCHVPPAAGDTRGAEPTKCAVVLALAAGGAPGRLLCCRRAKRERDGRNRVVGTRPPASLVLRAPEAGNANSERTLLLCVCREATKSTHLWLYSLTYELYEDGQIIG